MFNQDTRTIKSSNLLMFMLNQLMPHTFSISDIDGHPFKYDRETGELIYRIPIEIKRKDEYVSLSERQSLSFLGGAVVQELEAPFKAVRVIYQGGQSLDLAFHEFGEMLTQGEGIIVESEIDRFFDDPAKFIVEVEDDAGQCALLRDTYSVRKWIEGELLVLRAKEETETTKALIQAYEMVWTKLTEVK